MFENGTDPQVAVMPQQTFELKITMNAQGQINVNGPLENAVVCFGMMECAKEAIKEYNKSKQASGITLPPLNFKR